MHPRSLPHKQRLFVHLCHSGINPPYAYRYAGYRADPSQLESLAASLIDQPEIKAEMERLKDIDNGSFKIITRDEVYDALAAILMTEESNPQVSTNQRIAAARELNKMKQFYRPEPPKESKEEREYLEAVWIRGGHYVQHVIKIFNQSPAKHQERILEACGLTRAEPQEESPSPS